MPNKPRITIAILAAILAIGLLVIPAITAQETPTTSPTPSPTGTPRAEETPTETPAATPTPTPTMTPTPTPGAEEAPDMVSARLLLHITGSGFGEEPGSVMVDGMEADVIAWNNTDILAELGEIPTGPVTITVTTTDNQTAELNTTLVRPEELPTPPTETPIAEETPMAEETPTITPATEQTPVETPAAGETPTGTSIAEETPTVEETPVNAGDQATAEEPPAATGDGCDG